MPPQKPFRTLRFDPTRHVAECRLLIGGTASDAVRFCQNKDPALRSVLVFSGGTQKAPRTVTLYARADNWQPCLVPIEDVFPKPA